MTIISGLGSFARGLFADKKGPWGNAPDGDDPAKPAGPWGAPGGSGGRGPKGQGNPGASLEDFLERHRRKFGGGGGGGTGGGGLPFKPDRSLLVWALLALVALWLIFTMFHRISPGEKGVVTIFGRYSYTLNSGIGFTPPAPIARVEKVDVEDIREIPIGSGNDETLMLTGDQNIIDIAYQVRWSIRDPEQYLFELSEPQQTIREVGESVMRAVVANVSLQGVIGAQRGEIEQRVQEEMQKTLDTYRAGVIIRGVAIRQADPPGAVNDAFKDVTAAQQDAQSEINRANAYSLQIRQLAQGQATAFDKVYEQYKLAPDVTRRRMYYETMEQVLRNVDKTIVETPGVTPYLPLGQIQRPAQPREPAR